MSWSSEWNLLGSRLFWSMPDSHWKQIQPEEPLVRNLRESPYGPMQAPIAALR